MLPSILGKVLGPYREQFPMGDEPRFPAERLRKDLQTATVANRRWFVVCVVMLVAVFVIWMVATAQALHSPAVLKTLSAAFGITGGGLVMAMMRLWREKSAMDVLIVLIPALDNKQLTSVVQKLLAAAGGQDARRRSKLAF